MSIRLGIVVPCYDEQNVLPATNRRLLAVLDRLQGDGRIAGASRYTLRKMRALALAGVTSFNVVPLQLITVLGVPVSVFSFSMIVYIVCGALFAGAVVLDRASSVVPVYFLGGIELLSIGILGAYVAKIYLETKRRPRYIIEKTI